MKPKHYKYRNIDWHDRVFQITVYGCLAVTGVLALYPLTHILSASISNPVAVDSGRVLLLLVGYQLDGYRLIFKSIWVMIGYRNSLFYTAFGTLLNVSITFMAAYSLSRKDLYGRKIITLFMLNTEQKKRIMEVTVEHTAGRVPVYIGASGNSESISEYYYWVTALVFNRLNRRSQKKSFNWEQFKYYLTLFPLPKPKIRHNLYSIV